MQPHTDYRVLVVDDDERLCESMSRSLTRSGLSVAVARTTGEGKRLMDSEAFDAVLSDLKLPGGGGFELLKHSRELADQPVFVLLTGYGSVGVLASALQQGAADYFEKPISGSDLASRIIELLERRGEHGRVNDTETGPTAHSFDFTEDGTHPAGHTTAPQHACPTEARVVIRARGAERSAELAQMVRAAGLSALEVPSDVGAEVLATTTAEVLFVELDEEDADTVAFARAAGAVDPGVSLVTLSARPNVAMAKLATRLGAVAHLDDGDGPAERIEALQRGVSAHRAGRVRQRMQLLSGFGAPEAWVNSDRAASDLETGLSRLRLALEPIILGDFDRSLLGYGLVPRVDHQRLLTYSALQLVGESLGKPCAVLDRFAEVTAARAAEVPEDKLLFVPLECRDLPFLASVDHRLDQHAHRLVLEVAADAPSRAKATTQQAMRALHERGFRFAMRHHGVTFDAFDIAATPLPEYVVLGRDSVAGVDRARVRRSLVRSLIASYLEQGVLVISSGIASEAEFLTLKKTGCDIFRGPWVAPVMPSLGPSPDSDMHSTFPLE